MTAPASPAKRLPASIWALGFVSLLMDVSSEMIHSLLPVFLVTSLGVSMLAVGLIEGAAEATALVLKVFSGVLSDWWGRRKPLAVLGYGLGALSKPLFAIAPTVGLVVTARLIDRVGKGIRGAPRDALVADLAPPGMRGAAFGLRQSLDTVGAFLGPLLAMGLMLLWANDFRAVFWVAVIPAALCVALLLVGVQEPERAASAVRTNPIRRENLRRLGGAYWWVVALGAVFTLARFSEAFLVLRVQQGGLPLAWTPLVLVLMNVVFALGAYPLGKLADSTRHTTLLALGLVVLIAADALLAFSDRGAIAWLGIALWGLHMAMTQGLLATMVADTAPADLRGTAFGMFNLVSGVALLVASGLAGLLWDRLGASATFSAGMLFATLALVGVLVQSARHGRTPKPPAPQG
ncbi:MFS family permease [Acidovorax delafieldii]|uniref:MFS family permease n=1 Tax=Acidovorax delafieldii TaxID=47920 RepID=A0AAJ2F3D5_ACIDE|nr:MFS transporter [Acidovorax delafieldii]MDR6768704.1 MFS family permease [Acidovorax delafieldii]MDR6837420.1 MFS family permease [Acidovorax delafieldii]MDR7366910.1 MFS family permease [Acidovorax delafieldii]